MTAPILPTVIIGPAIVTWNGYSYYFKSEITAGYKRETFNVTTDFDGKIDERMATQMTEVSGTPDGMLSSSALSAMFPYPVTQIGASIFGTTALPLVIHTKFGGASNTGQTITYPRAALSKLPQLKLHPLSTLFGDIAFTCLGQPTIQPTTAGQWNTIVDSAFGDTTFDEKQIVTDIYSASFGSSPYNAMGSMQGFTFDLGMELDTIKADDYGVVDMILKSLTAAASFAPSNLTEAQFYALLNGQGSGYVYPGQSLSLNNTNLVVTGSGNGLHTLTATIYNAGPKDATAKYATASHRLNAVQFTSKRVWTAGVAQPLWALAST